MWYIFINIRCWCWYFFFSFLRLDIVHITVKNSFQWIGGTKSEINAVHLETMMVQVSLVSHNMIYIKVIETWLKRISKISCRHLCIGAPYLKCSLWCVCLYLFLRNVIWTPLWFILIREYFQWLTQLTRVVNEVLDLVNDSIMCYNLLTFN